MPVNRSVLERLKLSGYKSIREAEIEFSRLNVLIGANGSGKSNLVSFFAFLSAALNEKMDACLGRHGGPNALLYFGPQRTNEIAVEATVRTREGTGVLHQRLGFRAPDSLFYSDRAVKDYREGEPPEMVINDVCSLAMTTGEELPDETIYYALKERVATFHLADTSLTAPIRTEGYIEDNKRLNSNGSNLAAVLYRYKKADETAYRRIRSTVRKIVPSFDDFVLAPRELNPRNILLNWRQLGWDYLFGPHQLSDAALRAIALITVFQQPEDEYFPNLIVVDEPELGLHPHAMLIIAGLIRAASLRTQVLLATQSPTFLDNFNPEEVIKAEESQKASHYRRVTSDELRDWLQQYSLGELWQKNILGGGPLP